MMTGTGGLSTAVRQLFPTNKGLGPGLLATDCTFLPQFATIHNPSYRLGTIVGQFLDICSTFWHKVGQHLCDTSVTINLYINSIIVNNNQSFWSLWNITIFTLHLTGHCAQYPESWNNVVNSSWEESSSYIDWTMCII